MAEQTIAVESVPETPQRAPRLTWHGVKTVAQLELMQRLRSSKWKTLLIAWFIGVGAICVLFAAAVYSMSYDSNESIGPIIFATNVYFVLFMGLLITPSFSSTAINGERDKGTLAILQASLLTPLEITLGKLLASWAAAMSFLIVSLPFIFWAFAAGDVTIWATIAAIVTMALVLLVICAVSLYLSSRSPKTSGSTLSAYGFVAFVSVITGLIWLLLLATTQTEHTVQGYEGASYDVVTGEPTRCVATTHTTTMGKQDLFWPLLAVNPFILVADVTAPNTDEYDSNTPENAVLRSISAGVRSTRVDPVDSYVFDYYCNEQGEIRSPSEREEQYSITQTGSPLWPAGIAIYLAVGGLAVWRTTKRLNTPYKILHKGVRIA